jgi:hypothetical protein
MKKKQGYRVTHRVQVGDSVLIEAKNSVQSTLFLHNNLENNRFILEVGASTIVRAGQLITI